MAGDIHRIYEAAGFGGGAEWGATPALLVVDFSCGFTDPESPLGAEMSAELAQTGRVLDAARETGAPVMFTSIAYEEGLADGGPWLRKVPSLGRLTVGSRWVRLDPRLGRRPGEPVVYKRGPSAFFGTDVASLLVARHVDTVIVAGATTSGCVRASVVDAMQYGFHTVVPRECVGDRALQPHEANLFDMAAKYADVVSAQEVIDYLQSGKVPQRQS